MGSLSEKELRKILSDEGINWSRIFIIAALVAVVILVNTP